MMVHPIYQLYRNTFCHKKQFKCVERIEVDFLRTEGFTF